MNITKPFLIIQLRPEDGPSDNEFEAILKYGGLQQQDVERLRIEKTGIPHDLDVHKFSGIIVGGSPFDISTPQHEKPAIQEKIEQDFKWLFDDIVKHDFPFLGACSGNGLLGSYLGTSISGQYREAVGCVSLDITEDGKKDALLQGFPDKITVLLGHKEACDSLPTGASLLMTGSDCPIQMFRLGENVYATQFHPEGDSDGFILRIHAYKNHGYFKPEEAQALIKAVSREPTPFAQKILSRFVQKYAG